MNGTVKELLTDNETQLWMQEFPIHGNQPKSRSVIALPAAILRHGDYLIRLVVGLPDGRTELVKTYGFSVKRD